MPVNGRSHTVPFHACARYALTGGHLRRRVLALVTGELLAAGDEILLLERDAHGEQRLGHAVHRGLRPRCGAQALRGQRRIQQVDVRVACVALHDLRHDIADEPMVGMSGAAFRTEGEDRRGLDANR